MISIPLHHAAKQEVEGDASEPIAVTKGRFYYAIKRTGWRT